MAAKLSPKGGGLELGLHTDRWPTETVGMPLRIQAWGWGFATGMRLASPWGSAQEVGTIPTDSVWGGTLPTRQPETVPAVPFRASLLLSPTVDQAHRPSCRFCHSLSCRLWSRGSTVGWLSQVLSGCRLRLGHGCRLCMGPAAGSVSGSTAGSGWTQAGLGTLGSDHVLIGAHTDSPYATGAWFRCWDIPSPFQCGSKGFVVSGLV